MLAGFFGFLDFFGFFFAATARPSGNSDEGERESAAMGGWVMALSVRASVRG